MKPISVKGFILSIMLNEPMESVSNVSSTSNLQHVETKVTPSRLELISLLWKNLLYLPHAAEVFGVIEKAVRVNAQGSQIEASFLQVESGKLWIKTTPKDTAHRQEMLEARGSNLVI